jgi:hypothetical protein
LTSYGGSPAMLSPDSTGVPHATARTHIPLLPGGSGDKGQGQPVSVSAYPVSGDGRGSGGSQRLGAERPRGDRNPVHGEPGARSSGLSSSGMGGRAFLGRAFCFLGAALTPLSRSSSSRVSTSRVSTRLRDMIMLCCGASDVAESHRSQARSHGSRAPAGDSPRGSRLGPFANRTSRNRIAVSDLPQSLSVGGGSAPATGPWAGPSGHGAAGTTVGGSTHPGGPWATASGAHSQHAASCASPRVGLPHREVSRFEGDDSDLSGVEELQDLHRARSSGAGRGADDVGELGAHTLLQPTGKSVTEDTAAPRSRHASPAEQRPSGDGSGALAARPSRLLHRVAAENAYRVGLRASENGRGGPPPPGADPAAGLGARAVRPLVMDHDDDADSVSVMEAGPMPSLTVPGAPPSVSSAAGSSVARAGGHNSGWVRLREAGAAAVARTIQELSGSGSDSAAPPSGPRPQAEQPARAAAEPRAGGAAAEDQGGEEGGEGRWAANRTADALSRYGRARASSCPALRRLCRPPPFFPVPSTLRLAHTQPLTPLLSVLTRAQAARGKRGARARARQAARLRGPPARQVGPAAAAAGGAASGHARGAGPPRTAAARAAANAHHCGSRARGRARRGRAVGCGLRAGRGRGGDGRAGRARVGGQRLGGQRARAPAGAAPAGPRRAQ